jgi:hypothetical protein
MSLSKVSIIDKIEVLEDGVIQIRQRDDIQEDNAVISSGYVRWTLFPGQDIADQDPKVKAVASAVWTSDVVSAYESRPTKS